MGNCRPRLTLAGLWMCDEEHDDIKPVIKMGARGRILTGRQGEDEDSWGQRWGQRRDKKRGQRRFEGGEREAFLNWNALRDGDIGKHRCNERATCRGVLFLIKAKFRKQESKTHIPGSFLPFISQKLDLLHRRHRFEGKYCWLFSLATAFTNTSAFSRGANVI